MGRARVDIRMDSDQIQAAIKELQDAEESAVFQRRTEQNLAEITDKLNGLIGYVAGRGPEALRP